MPGTTARPFHVGDIVHVQGQRGLWKIHTIRPAQGGGTRITASSLHAYPRIDLTVPASRATLRTQE